MGFFSGISHTFSSVASRVEEFTGSTVHSVGSGFSKLGNAGHQVYNSVGSGISKVPTIIAAGATGGQHAIENIVNSSIIQTAGMNLAADLNIANNASALTPSILGLSASTVVLGGLGILLAVKVL